MKFTHPLVHLDGTITWRESDEHADIVCHAGLSFYGGEWVTYEPCPINGLRVVERHPFYGEVTEGARAEWPGLKRIREADPVRFAAWQKTWRHA